MDHHPKKLILTQWTESVFARDGKLSLRTVVLVLSTAAVATFGLPVLLGLAWFPLPLGPFTLSMATRKGYREHPAGLLPLDEFSSAHLDWPWRVTEAQI